MTSIALASAATGADYDTGQAAFVLPKPSGLTAGEVLLVGVLAMAGSTITPPTPATGTWNLEKLESTNANIRLAVYSRVVDSADAAASSFSFSVTATPKGSIVGFRLQNVDTTTPVEAASSWTVTLVGTSGAQTVTSLTAGNRLVYFAIGRHTATGGGARSWSTSDGSDVQEWSHGGNAGSGFDQAIGAWYSNRDLTAGAESRTVTTNTGTETAASGVMVVLKPATPPTLKARAVQASLSAPQALPPLRARVVQASLTAPAPSGGKTARVVQASLTAPLPAGSPGRSGAYVAAGGNIKRVAVYAAKAGQVV